MEALSASVGDVMATRIEMVSDTTPMSFAANLMVEKHITGLPVTTELGELIGVLSWSDVGEALTAPPQSGRGDFYRLDPGKMLLGQVPALDGLTGTVADFMSREVVAVGTDATVADAARLMKQADVQRVLVVDGAGNLAGLVSAIDIVRHIAPPA